MKVDVEELLSRAYSGDRVAIGKILSVLETPNPISEKLLSELISRSGRAHVIGVTGIPGSGKSTLISKLISYFRKKDLKIGVLAVDPTSPLSKGAIMADRVRMQKHSTDPQVFIRSLASRGFKGGLSLATLAMVEALDALGYNKVIIETVGVGQADVDVMGVAHTIVVVTMPGAGDEIQALKAGVMEIGDVYVVNKSDLPGAEDTLEFVKFSVEYGEIGVKRDWKPPVLKTIATQNVGVEDLGRAIEHHMEYLMSKNSYYSKITSRRVALAKLYVRKILEDFLENVVEREGEEIISIIENSPNPYGELKKYMIKRLREGEF